MKIKKMLCSVLITLLCSFGIFVSNVNATIKETVDSNNSSLAHIENGTTIVGITKFSPNTLVTAKRVSQATMNDIAYNLDNLNYGGVHIYYYYYGWYELDENSTAQPVLDQNSLKELDIFYVDNVEKKVTINYEGDSNVNFKTDKANKDRDVSLSNGVITVPATVRELRVLNANNNSLLATYVKVNSSDMDFKKNPHMGKIVSNENQIFSLSEDDTIVFQGNIPYTIKEDENTLNGNYVSVGIMLDSAVNNTVPNKDNTKVIVYDAANLEGREESWENDTGHDVDVLFSEDLKGAIIEVIWEEGHSQFFTVALTESTTLEAAPEGTIDWDYTTGMVPNQGFQYDITSQKDTIMFNDKVAYYESLNGLKAGNRVGIEITPNAKYKDAVRNKTVIVSIEGSVEGEDATWELNNTMDGIIYTPLVTDENREIFVKVTWEKGFTQTFKIDASTALLMSN